MSRVATALSLIEQLIKGVKINSFREQEHAVVFLVEHPKRKIDPTSFVRAAKKLGWIAGGTPSASNRNKIIVAYITPPDRTTELCVKGTTEGPIHVEVRFKV